MRIFYLLILLLCTLPLWGIDEEENFICLNTGNGRLTHNTIQAIARDSNGYIWVGTNYGLNRLDGYQTINYVNDPNDSTSISSSFIKALFVDSQNDLWVGTIGGGLNKYDRNTNGFIHFAPSSSPNSISGLNISVITEDKSGHIWIGMIGNCVNRYDKKTGQFKRYNLDKMDPARKINSNVDEIFSDTDGNIWVGMNQGEVFKINTQTDFTTYYGLKSYHNHFKDVGSIKGISQLKNGTLLFASWSGNLYKLNTETDDHIKEFKDAAFFDNNNLTDVTVDNDGTIWVSTWERGLYSFNPNTSEKKYYSRDKNIPTSLGSNALNQLLLDDRNNLLIGTLDNGLSILPLKKKMFKTLPLKDPVTSSNKDFNSYSILRDDYGYLWIGTRGEGLIRYNLKTSEHKSYLANKNRGMESNSILTLKKSDNGKIWIGTDGKFITLLDPLTEKFTPMENRFDDWSKAIFCLAENKEFLWCGSWGGGIKKVDRKTGRYTSIDFDEKDQFRNSIFDLELQDSILWVANVGMGLIKYNIHTGHQTIYCNSEKFPGFPKERIIDIFIENPHTFWLSTDGAGTYKFDPIAEKIENLNEKYPISGTIVQSIIPDKEGKIWIASISGVTCINPSNGICYNFDKSNGLLNNQLNKSALFFDTIDNIIYVGGVEGVNFFNPSEIIIDSTKARVNITELRIMGKRIHNPNGRNISKAIDITDKIDLYNNDKIVSLNFSSMEFNPSGKNRYLYKLEGFDKDFVETPFSENVVQYTNLYPGEYIFKVKASNNDGILSDQITAIKIVVHPAFWQTILFRLGVIVLIICLVFIYIKIHYKKLYKAKVELENKVKERTSEIQKQKEQIEQQNRELETANDTKNKFFSIISHDLRNPVTAIDQLAQLILMHHNVVSSDKMLSYFHMLKKSSENTLELLDDLLIWARTQTNRIEIQKMNIAVDDLILGVVDICKPTAENKNIILLFPPITGLTVNIDKKTIQTVLRNLTTNAIKFSYPGEKVQIEVEEGKEEVIFKVIDSGIGMTDDEIKSLFKIEKLHSRQGTSGETGTGLGLILCQEFLALNNGKIWVESDPDGSRGSKGTTFYFSVKKAPL
ncbi:MAG TPA: two-component regulator propeller domain-containing protein [Prolixibacteraceae bacterium]|nr:two-component regulator propeller domain-containing protein [Prolixibacteraceae bacterium]